MLNQEDKIYCPNCGEELASIENINSINNRAYLDCAFCESQITIELDKYEYKIIVFKEL